MARQNKLLVLFAALISVSGAATACEELYDAAAMGDLDRVMELVATTEGGAACRAKWGYTPLHGVVTGHGVLVEDDLKIAQFLIDQGAAPDAMTDDGITPLHICPYPELIELLVENGASLETEDSGGSTAILYYAEASNGPAALTKALQLGANPNHKDKRGQTALDIAMLRNETDKERVLLRYGANRIDATKLTRTVDDGTYTIYLRRPGDSGPFKVMESSDEVGAMDLCEDGRAYAFTVENDGKAWVNLQTFRTGMLKRLGEVDSIHGEIECATDEVHMTTANLPYSFSRTGR